MLNPVTEDGENDPEDIAVYVIVYHENAAAGELPVFPYQGKSGAVHRNNNVRAECIKAVYAGSSVCPAMTGIGRCF